MDRLTFDGNRKLFRGKNEKGIWVFGSLLQCQDVFGNSEVFIYQSEKTGNQRQHKILDSKTIAQFTGYTVNYPDLQRSELVKAQADQPECFEHYVVSVTTPMDDTLVHSSVQAL